MLLYGFLWGGRQCRIAECEHAAIWDVPWKHIFIRKPELSIYAGFVGSKRVPIQTMHCYNAGGGFISNSNSND